jgi:hypothetical protein
MALSVAALNRKMVVLAWLLMKRREYYRGMSNEALEKKLRSYKSKKSFTPIAFFFNLW